MIEVYGKGVPGDLVKPLLHHAPGVSEIALAVLAGLWVHGAHRDPDRRHQLHVGKGGNGWNLYLDSGEKLAFRGGVGTDGAYDRVDVHMGVRPLGTIVLTMRSPGDTDALWELLDRLLAGSRVVPAP